MTASFAGFLAPLRFHPLPNAVIAEAPFNIAAYEPALYDRYQIPRHDRFDKAVPKRQADFLAGRLVARAALEHLGAPAQSIPTGPDRGPIWPVGWTGSISHTDKACAALVAPQGMLCGIDCEHIARGSSLEAIMARCLSDQERRWCQSQIAHPADILATFAFSAKECLYKALAPTVQRIFGFDCAQIEGWSHDGTLTLSLTETLHPALPKDAQFDVHCHLGDGMVRTWLLAPRASGA